MKSAEGYSLDFGNASRHIDLLVMEISYTVDVGNRQYYWVVSRYHSFHINLIGTKPLYSANEYTA